MASKHNSILVYLIIIILSACVGFLLSNWLYTKQLPKYSPTKIVVVEYTKVDTVYISKVWIKEKPAKTDSFVAFVSDTLVTEEADSIIMNIAYYFPPENKFEYIVDLRKSQINKTIVDSVFVPVEVPVIREIYRNDYRLAISSGVVGVILGFVVGLLVD